MAKEKSEGRRRGNSPAPRTGAFDAAEEDKRRVPPHEAPIIQTEVPSADLPAPEAEPKRSFVDMLADAFGQMPPGRLAHYYRPAP